MRSRKPGANRSIWASIRSLMSTLRAVGDVAVGPQRVLPRRRPRRIDDAGLRHQAEGALRVATGRDLRLALRHLGEGAAHVERSPPRGTRSACQGTGPSSAQSTLQTPGPYRKCSRPRRYRIGSRSPARSISWRGVTSRTVTRAGGRSCSFAHPLPGDDAPVQRLELGRRGRRRCARCRLRPRATRARAPAW